MDPPRKGVIAPQDNHPIQGPKHPPGPISSAASALRGGKGWGDGDGQRPPGDPDALLPGVGVGGLGRESSGAACGAPASTPGAQTGKTEEGQKRSAVAVRREHLQRPLYHQGPAQHGHASQVKTVSHDLQ